MAMARQTAEWDRAAAIVAMVHNIELPPSKRKTPLHFHPIRRLQAQRFRPITTRSIDLLRSIIRRTKPH